MNSYSKYSALIKNLIEEFVIDKGISDFEDTNRFKNKFLTAIQNFNENIVGYEVDYDEDVSARSLLKEYVFYDFYNMLPEFMGRYQGEIVKLQLKYNSTIIQ